MTEISLSSDEIIAIRQQLAEGKLDPNSLNARQVDAITRYPYGWQGLPKPSAPFGVAAGQGAQGESENSPEL